MMGVDDKLRLRCRSLQRADHSRQPDSAAADSCIRPRRQSPLECISASRLGIQAVPSYQLLCCWPCRRQVTADECNTRHCCCLSCLFNSIRSCAVMRPNELFTLTLIHFA